MTDNENRLSSSDVVTLLSTYSNLLDEYERMGINTTLAIFGLVGVLLTVVSYIYSAVFGSNRQSTSILIPYGKEIIIILLILVTIIITVYSYVYTYAIRKAAIYRGYCGYLEKILFTQYLRKSDKRLDEDAQRSWFLHDDLMIKKMKDKDINSSAPKLIAVIVALVQALCFIFILLLLWGKWFMIFLLAIYGIATLDAQLKNKAALRANWSLSEDIIKGKHKRKKEKSPSKGRNNRLGKKR